MTRVYLFGGSGQLGTSIQKLFPTSYRFYAPNSTDVPILKTVREIEKTIRLYDPHVVINCAAMTNVDLCEQEQIRAYAINTGAPLAMAMAAKKVGSLLVHLSTDYVFGNMYSAPHKEFDFTTNPLSVYGKSKLHSEELVLGTLDALVIRTSGLYGDSFLKKRPPFIDTIIDNLQQGKPTSALDDRIASPTYADHLALAIHHLILNKCTGLYHGANRGAVSWYEFALEVCRQIGGDQSLIIPTKHADKIDIAPRPAYSALDSTKLKIAGFTMPPWTDGIKDYLACLKVNK